METELRNNCQEISLVLSKMNREDEVYSFLRDLLSSSEIQEFSHRFRVARMLQEGVSYKKIEESTGMSSTTIARISKFLKGENHGYARALVLLQEDSL
ncbi:MAG: YerC/YecD family TrpR-related protein [Candidatus Gracilibacteria bacterium]|nr:YerC/YecD family TrpR-related protein [Candidatus Gracilibacteria bacterium]